MLICRQEVNDKYMATETLSPKAKENLQRNAELRQKDSKFIKLQPSERRTLKFNPEKIDQVEAEFNGRKSIRYRYTVTESNSGNSDQEKYLEVRSEERRVGKE